MKKILVSDYDSTFYLNDDDMELNKQSVDKFMSLGNLFVIATGRSYFDFYHKLDIYKFNYNYAILNHGATIIDNQGNILFNIAMDNKIIPKIKDDLDLEQSISYFCCSGKDSRVDFETKDLTKINVKYADKKYAFNKAQYINQKYGKYVKAYFVGKDLVEIISNKTNKKDAISYLMKMVDEVDPMIYTIGDGYSDLEMIKGFNGYCMKDSVEEIKKYAIKEYSSVSNLIDDIMNEKYKTLFK